VQASCAWSALTTAEQAHARAAGRRHYNVVRQLYATLRRAEVARLLRAYGYDWGVQARIARQLGVSQATVSRDVAAILAACQAADHRARVAAVVARMARDRRAARAGRVEAG
jgi:DNA-binding NarL/FixJ family response regulator